MLGAGTAIVQGLEQPAHAELPPLLRKSIRRYAEPLQRAADELVFEVRPAVVSGNWTKVSSFFVGGAYAKSNTVFMAPVIGVVNGNEDLLPGAEDAVEKLDAVLRFMGTEAASGDANGKQKRVVEAWGDAAATINSVMAATNEAIAGEPEMKDLKRLVRIPLDGSAYGRTLADYSAGCKGMVMEGVCIGGD